MWHFDFAILVVLIFAPPALVIYMHRRQQRKDRQHALEMFDRAVEAYYSKMEG